MTEKEKRIQAKSMKTIRKTPSTTPPTTSKRQNKPNERKVIQWGEIPSMMTRKGKISPKNKAHPVNLNGGDTHQLIMKKSCNNGKKPTSD